MAGRGRRRGVILLVILLVIVGLLVVADRVAVGVAESKIATLVAQQTQAQQIKTNGDPDVTIEGFPFLTQVFSGEYDAIDITFNGITAQGVTLSKLDVKATDVSAQMSDLMKG